MRVISKHFFKVLEPKLRSSSDLATVQLPFPVTAGEIIVYTLDGGPMDVKVIPIGDYHICRFTATYTFCILTLRASIHGPFNQDGMGIFLPTSFAWV